MSKRKFYAVVKGYKPGIYDQWFGVEGAEVQVNGFSNGIYKGFATRAEAQAWYTKIASSLPLHPERHSASNSKPPENGSPKAHIDPATALQEGKVVIYTDGACHGNPGAGGYASVLCYKDHRKELTGGFARTTNNRMELMAAIRALQCLKGQCSVVIYSDSAYVVHGIQKGWAKKWRRHDWKRKDQGEWKDVKNADLWQQLLELCEAHVVEFVQIPGHAGVAENERCDELAVRASRQARLPMDHGFEASLVE